MLKIKRLYTFMLQTFLPLFFMTFGICLFIVLMQFLWRYIDDMVGKGLSMMVLAEMFMYAALFLVPMALPLSILLASLMTFGNLGESLELLAMKSTGVSLLRIMKTLIITVVMISIGAFFFQNYAMPVIQVKLYTLLLSIRQKSPELDIPEGVFYSQITGFNVYVKHKDKETGLLKDLMIYDYSNGFNNASVIVADSGRLKTSEDKTFLVLSLFNGESFANLKDQSKNGEMKNSVPYRRETFGTRDILIEFNSNFSRNDESFMANQYVGKNMHDLQHYIDSSVVVVDSIQNENAKGVIKNAYKSTFNEHETSGPSSGTGVNKDDKTLLASDVTIQDLTLKEMKVKMDFDSLWKSKTPTEEASLLAKTKTNLETLRSDIFFKAATIGDEAHKIRRHKIEWHKKFTLSFACLIFFFIGAPLGAIIRKGGLGTPVVISVILFIFYYIIDNIGLKMARDGVWTAFEGMWLSSAVLTPLGIFLTYKAAHDSVILDADTYLNALKNLIGRKAGRKIERKEVIMFNPDYENCYDKLVELQEMGKSYLATHRRWINYLTFWKNSGKDQKASNLTEKMDYIIEELSNSDQNLVLNKLMDFPIISGYSQFYSKLDRKSSMAIGLFLPLGIILYLVAIYQRKLLRHDIQAIVKTCEDMTEILINHDLKKINKNNNDPKPAIEENSESSITDQTIATN